MVMVQPIFEGSLDRLADALAETADSVSIDVLRGVMGAKREFSALQPLKKIHEVSAVLLAASREAPATRHHARSQLALRRDLVAQSDSRFHRV